MNKSQAIHEVNSKGFNFLVEEGESGDYTLGSRLYFIRQDGEPGTAEVSKLPGEWVTSYFSHTPDVYAKKLANCKKAT